MNIYFKFLNDWILLDNELDDICGDIPEHFVEFINETIEKTNINFVKILHNSKEYYVHISNLQWCS